MIFQKISLWLTPLFLINFILVFQQIAMGSTPVCPAQLTENINAIADRPQFIRARWGILVQQLNSPKTLYSRDAEKYFIPASNVKLFTSAAALQQLGADFRFHTSVYQNGDGVLVVLGKGDPSLTDVQLKLLAQQLKQKGVTKIKQLIADDSYFQGNMVNPSWEWEDIQSDYGAPISSFILNENTFSLKLVPSSLGEVAQVIWDDQDEAKKWQIINQVVTVASDQPTYIDIINISRDLSGTVLRVKGQIGVKSSPYLLNLPITEPNNHFLYHLRTALLSANLSLAKVGVVNGGKYQTEIATIESPPLAELLTYMNLNSDNLYAESLLRTLSKKKVDSLDQNSDQVGLEVVKDSLSQLGVDPKSYVLVDGSGLSRHDLVSPQALVEILQAMAKTPNASIYQGSLPVAGKSGTLANRFRNSSAQGIVQAKTGSMTGVFSLSGYIEPPNYQPLVFSIIVNESDQSGTVIKQAIDEIVVLLTQLKQCG